MSTARITPFEGQVNGTAGNGHIKPKAIRFVFDERSRIREDEDMGGGKAHQIDFSNVTTGEKRTLYIPVIDDKRCPHCGKLIDGAIGGGG